MKSKIIKVLYSTRTRRDFDSIYAKAMRYIWTPKISIEGKWLEALGYHIGDPIHLEYDEQGIHIRPLTETERTALEQQQARAELDKKIVKLEELKAQLESESAALSRVAEPPIPYQVSAEKQPAGK